MEASRDAGLSVRNMAWRIEHRARPSKAGKHHTVHLRSDAQEPDSLDTSSHRQVGAIIPWGINRPDDRPATRNLVPEPLVRMSCPAALPSMAEAPGMRRTVSRTAW